MTMREDSFIAVAVEYAELVERRTFFIAVDVTCA